MVLARSSGSIQGFRLNGDVICESEQFAPLSEAVSRFDYNLPRLFATTDTTIVIYGTTLRVHAGSWHSLGVYEVVVPIGAVSLHRCIHVISARCLKADRLPRPLAGCSAYE
jgi:hypothetical protein